MKTMKTCNECVHQIPIPGNCHIGCANHDARPRLMRWPGCGTWPLNFDQNIIKSCDGFSDDPKDKIDRKPNPLLDLLRLLS